MLALLALSAGCLDDGDDDAASEASLSFDGADDGQHAEAASCQRGGQLAGAATVQDGMIDVTIRDGDGAVVFSQAYNGDVDLEGETLEGSDGDWTLQVERQEGFEGEYGFVLVCS